MKWLLGIGALLVASQVLAADTYVTPTTDADGCRIWTLCDDEDDVGVCEDSSDTNSLVIAAGAEYTFSAWADTSGETGGPYTIKIYDRTPRGGYSATARTLLNSTDMDEDNMKFSWNGTCGDIFAEVAGTLTGGITLVVRGCKLTVGP